MFVAFASRHCWFNLLTFYKRRNSIHNFYWYFSYVGKKRIVFSLCSSVSIANKLSYNSLELRFPFRGFLPFSSLRSQLLLLRCLFRIQNNWIQQCLTFSFKKKRRECNEKAWSIMFTWLLAHFMIFSSQFLRVFALLFMRLLTMLFRIAFESSLAFEYRQICESGNTKTQPTSYEKCIKN